VACVVLALERGRRAGKVSIPEQRSNYALDCAVVVVNTDRNPSPNLKAGRNCPLLLDTTSAITFEEGKATAAII